MNTEALDRVSDAISENQTQTQSVEQNSRKRKYRSPNMSNLKMITQASHGRELVSTGNVLQLEGEYDDHFVKVFNILEHVRTGEVWLQGHLFAANASLGGLVPEVDNEVTMIVNIIQDDECEVAVQALEMIPIHNVLRHRVLKKVWTSSSPVISSNINQSEEQASGLTLSPEANPASSDPPSLSAPSPSESSELGPTSSSMMNESGVNSLETASTPTLICRRIYFKIHRSDSHFRKTRTPPHGGVLRLLLERECGISKTSQQSCKRHRASPEPSKVSAKMKPLTFADICHGAGGASLAARYAGFTVAYACDICQDRHETFKLNHPQTLQFKEDINHFLRFYRGQHADCMHFSMPCKCWSMAHTRPGKDDDKNSLVIFEIPKILRAAQPRQVTMEQVPGMVRAKKHYPHFLRLVRMIHEEGYTVAWHEFAFSSFGLCSKRERLFLFASRNSRFGVRRELLPAWPLPTHGPPGSGLLKYHTVADALRGIPLGATHHQPEKDWQQLEPKRETWDPNGLCRTPTCKSQGSLWHHSGKRPFTVREMARLQSFPDDYNFIGSKTQMYSQIGDAIPPVPFTPFLRSVHKTLEDTNSGAKNPSQSIYNQPVLEPNEDEIEEANQGFMEGEQDFDGIKPEALEK